MKKIVLIMESIFKLDHSCFNTSTTTETAFQAYKNSKINFLCMAYQYPGECIGILMFSFASLCWIIYGIHKIISNRSISRKNELRRRRQLRAENPHEIEDEL